MVVAAAALVIGAVPSVYAQPGDVPASGELKNVAVVAGARYEKLISDITFLGSLAGKPELGQMVEGGMNFFTQGKGAAALDKTQAWGVVVQTDGQQIMAVACLPVAKPNDLLEVAKGYGAEIKDGEDGTKQLVLPSKKSIFVKQDGGMTFISMSDAALKRLPADPQALLNKMVGEYDIAAHVLAQNVPKTYRDFAVQAMKAGAQQGLKKKDGESDEQFAERQKMTEAQLAQMDRMINEIDSIKFGWAVDSQQQKTFLDVAYTFVPDSKMAKQMLAYKDPKTNFAGFYQPDAAATLSFAAQADPAMIAENLAQLDATMKSSRDQLNAAIDKEDKISDPEAKEALKAAAGDFFDAVTATIKSGQMDGGGSLHISPDSLTLVSGLHMSDTAKVESALKKLEAAAKKSPDFPGVKWNAAKHAGIAFHTITIPVPEKEKAPRQILGSELNVAVGIGSDAVYVAAGKDNIEAVKKAIDASAANKGKSVPPFEFVLSLTPIVEVAASQAEPGDKKEVAQKVADYLRSEAQGRDHIRAVGKMVPNGQSYHFEAEEGVLKAIGKAATASQELKMKAQQAQ